MKTANPSRPVRTNDILRCGEIELDTAAGLAWCAGLPVRLTPKESALLAVFLAAPGRAFSRQALLGLVWEAPCGGGLRTRTVDMHIRHLRQKLGAWQRIETVYRFGYRWAWP